MEARLPIHAVSITDNPGGNPAIAPEALGAELQAMGLDALIHFACTDANRNLIEARAYGLARGRHTQPARRHRRPARRTTR